MACYGAVSDWRLGPEKQSLIGLCARGLMVLSTAPLKTDFGTISRDLLPAA